MIKIGDIVRLKSGGPCMTVQQFKDKSINSDNNFVLCKWFDSNNISRQDWFEVNSLSVRVVRGT